MKASYLNSHREEALKTLRSNYESSMAGMTLAVDVLLGIAGEYEDPEELLYLCADVSFVKQLLCDLCPDENEL